MPRARPIRRALVISMWSANCRRWRPCCRSTWMPLHPDTAASQSLLDKLATALVTEGRAVLHDVLPPGQLALLSRRAATLDAQGALVAAATGRGEGRRLNAAVRSDGIHWLHLADTV